MAIFNRTLEVALTLDIALLGTPEVLVDGAPLSVDTRKAVALLAYLAVTGWPQVGGSRSPCCCGRTRTTRTGARRSAGRSRRCGARSAADGC